MQENEKVTSQELQMSENNEKDDLKTDDKEYVIDFLKNEVKELRQQLKEFTETTRRESQTELSISDQTVYDQIEVVPTEVRTIEQAEALFNRRLSMLEEAKGTPYEALVFGKNPSDMWGALYLKKKGLINNLDDFMRVKREAAENVRGIEIPIY